MVMDTRRCIGCHSCTVACKVNNELPIDMIYNPVFTVRADRGFPSRQHDLLSALVHALREPALRRMLSHRGIAAGCADGIVWVDQNKCIGCKACIMACPYHARHQNAKTGTVQKCDFCKERVREGLEPFCVQTCHQRARIFGDLDDPESAVSQIVRGMNTLQLLPEIGTDPQVYYIVSPGGQV